MDKYLRLQASVFGNFKNIDLSQESMSKLYQIYLKENLMPAVMKEFDIASQNVVNRPNFVANNNSIAISIGSNRLDISSDISAGDNMLSKELFIETATKYLKEFFAIFNVNASRMSFITEGVLKIIDNSSEAITAKNFLNTDHVYNSSNIFEWSANSVSLDEWNINEKTEKVNLNVTTSLRRMNAVKNGQPALLNGLVLEQDLNTLAENNSLRLTFSDIEVFLKLANQKNEAILKVIEGK